MNQDERLRQTINAWRVENGYPPYEEPKYPEIRTEKTGRPASYWIGYALGVVTVAAVVIGLLGLVGLAVWKGLR